ncbi:hypothetical protein [Brevibacillus sp. H7]|uniref:hypothetical protein n=1 Tax=Brevibacillus sp. H7 TaxID=3349138 RepID=UPI003829E06B
MNHLCPICNGFHALRAVCRACGQTLDDSGRIYDYYGDYSPYREIDDSKLSNGFPDFQYHLCIHVGWCPACRQEQLVSVREWDEQQWFTHSLRMP